MLRAVAAIVLSAAGGIGCFSTDFPAACTDNPAPCTTADASNGVDIAEVHPDSAEDVGANSDASSKDTSDSAVTDSSIGDAPLDSGIETPPTDAPDACTGVGCTPVVGLARTLAASNCAIFVDGKVRCWGRNAGSILGDGTGIDQPRPVLITELTGAREIGLGSAHGCARFDDGSVACWGKGSNGALGDGTYDDHPTPKPVAGLIGAKAIAVGGSDSCALLDSGSVKCWGFGYWSTTGSRFGATTPIDIGLTGVTALAAGDDTFCMLQGTKLSCWGGNGGGQVGDGSKTPVYAPHTIAGAFSAVTMSTNTVCAASVASGPSCWGLNNGFATSPALGSEALVPIAATSVVFVDAKPFSVGHDALFFGASDGGLRAVGLNASGALGSSTASDTATPIAVPAVTKVTAVSAGYSHACAIAAEGVVCWGDNRFGEIGNGLVEAIPRAPTAVIW